MSRTCHNCGNSPGGCNSCSSDLDAWKPKVTVQQAVVSDKPLPLVECPVCGQEYPDHGGMNPCPTCGEPRRITIKDFGTMPNAEFVVAVMSTNDRRQCEIILAAALSKAYDKGYEEAKKHFAGG